MYLVPRTTASFAATTPTVALWRESCLLRSRQQDDIPYVSIHKTMQGHPLQVVRTAFHEMATEKENTSVKRCSETLRTISLLYNTLFGEGTFLSNQLNADLFAHCAEIMDGVSGDEKLIPTLQSCIKRAGGSHIASRGDSGAVNLWGFAWSLRIVKFVSLFMKELANTNHSAKQCARNSYQHSLQRFHSFLVGGVVKTGMNLVKDRTILLNDFGFLGDEDGAKKEIMACVHVLDHILSHYEHWMKSNGVTIVI